MSVRYPVGAGNPVTLRDLGVFVDQAAEPVPSQDPDIRARDGRMLASGGRAVVKGPVLEPPHRAQKRVIGHQRRLPGDV